jgi:hypothetical protein
MTQATDDPGPHRPGHVVGDVVPDEQHLPDRALRGGDHQFVEERFVLSYIQRVGDQSHLEHLMHACQLQRRPAGLRRGRISGQHKPQPQPGQLMQSGSGFRVYAFLADHMIFAIGTDRAAVM